MSSKTFKNFIGGEWVAAANGKTFDNRNPARWSEVVGKFPDSGPREVQRAVKSAQRGFPVW